MSKEQIKKCSCKKPYRLGRYTRNVNHNNICMICGGTLKDE